MRFQKGKEKTGGKKKGCKSTKVLLREAFIFYNLNGGQERFRREFMKLKGRAFIISYLALSEYCIPKMKSVKYKEAIPTRQYDLSKLSYKELLLYKELLEKCKE